jgi:hypothetical protein
MEDQRVSSLLQQSLASFSTISLSSHRKHADLSDFLLWTRLWHVQDLVGSSVCSRCCGKDKSADILRVASTSTRWDWARLCVLTS